MPWIRLESPAYWFAFVAAFLAVAIWESAHPLRPLASAASRRWGHHAALYAGSAIAVGLVLRVSPVFVAFTVRDSHYGLLNRGFLPGWLSFALTILALDFLHYAIHRLFHAVYFLWRIHAVHHSDYDYDVSTAARFHPFEIFITQSFYLAGIALLAPPPGAVLIAELLTITENFFVHANQSLPPRLERALRWIIITPDLHRIHHSEEFAEQNLNFGQLLPWWDRLFGTYTPAPAAGPEHFVTGLKELRGADTLPVQYMLTEPFHAAVATRPEITTASNSSATTRLQQSEHS